MKKKGCKPGETKVRGKCISKPKDRIAIDFTKYSEDELAQIQADVINRQVVIFDKGLTNPNSLSKVDWSKRYYWW